MAEKPNDTARLQFLAVLEYLLTKTDEKHPSSTNEIINFAEEQYGVSLRREQAKSIVEHIYELCKTRKKVLPYEIMCSDKTQVNRKYYVSKKVFDTDTIVKICAAIENEKTISSRDSSALIKQLVEDYVVGDKQKIVSNKINQRNRNVKKMNDDMSEKLDDIYHLESTRNIFSFRLTSVLEDVFESSCRRYGPHNEQIEANKLYRGVVIKTEEDKENKRIFVFIYLQELAAIIRTKFNNIYDVVDYNDSYNDLMDADAQFRNRFYSKRNGDTYVPARQFKTVREVLQSRWESERHFNYPIEFKFCINRKDKPDLALLNRVKHSYEDFFKQPMRYEEKEREVVQYKGTEYEETVTALDIYVKVNTNFFDFQEWVTKKAFILDNVVVMSPEYRRWNDLLVGRLITLYVNRLNKYGYSYHYTLDKTLTEQAQIETAEREARLEKIKKEKADRLLSKNK